MSNRRDGRSLNAINERYAMTGGCGVDQTPPADLYFHVGHRWPFCNSSGSFQSLANGFVCRLTW